MHLSTAKCTGDNLQTLMTVCCASSKSSIMAPERYQCLLEAMPSLKEVHGEQLRIVFHVLLEEKDLSKDSLSDPGQGVGNLQPSGL